MKFGGTKELTGSIDLVSRYKLVAHHDFYCKRLLPFSLLDAHYLHNIVGDTNIRKGDGMQLDELIRQSPCVKDTNSRIQPFALDILQDAFQLQESSRVHLFPDEKGVPNVGSRFRNCAAKDKEKKHKKRREKEKRIDKEDKEKDSHKHRSKDKEKEMKNMHLCFNPTDQSQNCQEKKRKHEGNEGINEQKKIKDKSLRLEGMNETKASKVKGREKWQLA